MASWKESIFHWKKKLERGTSEEKTLQILNKLQKLPITLALLQETGIGKTVNALKKHDGEISIKSREIVATWKQLVSNGSTQSSPLKSKSSSSHGKHERSSYGEGQETNQPRYREEQEKYSNGHHSNSLSYEPTSQKQSTYSEENTSQSASHYNSSIYSQGNETPEDTDACYDPSSSKDDYRGYLKSMRSSSQVDNDPYVEKQDSYGIEETDEHYKVKSVDKPSASSSSSGKSRNGKHERDKLKDSKTGDNKKTPVKKNIAEEFDNSIASFEACLGFNDVVTKKSKPKPKPTSTKGNVSSSSGSSINEASTSSGSTRISHATKPVKKEQISSQPEKEKSSSDKLKRFKRLKESEEKIPEELKRPKLVPLNVDILSTLPEIQPDYKPLRLRMPDSPPQKKKAMTLEEAIQYTSSRREKTAVYAGRRNQYLTEVPTLYDTCVRVLIENIDDLGHTGGIPYDMLKPVLKVCTPAQLYSFEDYNTYVLEDTDELWLVHCQRDFKGKCPDKGETWRDLYLKLHDEREAKLKSVTANISASMKKAVPVRQTKLAYVDSVAKPPRDVARRQAKHGTCLPNDFPMKPGLAGKGTQRPIQGPINSAMAAASTGSSAGSSGPIQIKKPKVAPLMQKTLKFMKQRFRR